MMLELNAKTREILGKKVKALRKKGVIPAVVYGEKVKSMPLEVGYKEFEDIYEIGGESTIIKLKIGPPAGGEGKNVLIHDVSKDPVSDKFIHVDFYVVRMDKVIRAEVHLVFEGESPAVETEEGTLVKNITEVEVEALPANLPSELKVDISVLKTFDDLIHVKDLKVAEGVKILAEPEEVVASVTPPRSEEELAALEEKVEEEVEEVEKVGEDEEPSVASEEAMEGKEEEKPKEEKRSEAESSEASGEGGKE